MTECALVDRKLSHKKWKANLKKQKRKLRRQTIAQQQLPSQNDDNCEDGNDESPVVSSDVEKTREKEHLLWLQREKEAQEAFQAKILKEEKEKIRRQEEEKRIREEFLEQERKEELAKEEAEKKREKYLNVKKNDEGLNEKNQVWHNPEAPAGYVPSDDVRECPFFRRVGACRYGNKCSKAHILPQQSTTLLFSNMFTSFELEQTFRDDYNSDILLEFEEKDKLDEFKIFYEDVYPEFRRIGRIRMFVVCCNIEPHLRGNVYVDYFKLSHALEAYRKFNGRWYNKRQLYCTFVDVPSWNYAICGLFNRNMCLKGRNCSFLHAFQNPLPPPLTPPLPDDDDNDHHHHHSHHHRKDVKYRSSHIHKDNDNNDNNNTNDNNGNKNNKYNNNSNKNNNSSNSSTPPQQHQRSDYKSHPHHSNSIRSHSHHHHHHHPRHKSRSTSSSHKDKPSDDDDSDIIRDNNKIHSFTSKSKKSRRSQSRSKKEHSRKTFCKRSRSRSQDTSRSRDRSRRRSGNRSYRRSSNSQRDWMGNINSHSNAPPQNLNASLGLDGECSREKRLHDRPNKWSSTARSDRNSASKSKNDDNDEEDDEEIKVIKIAPKKHELFRDNENDDGDDNSDFKGNKNEKTVGIGGFGSHQHNVNQKDGNDDDGDEGDDHGLNLLYNEIRNMIFKKYDKELTESNE